MKIKNRVITLTEPKRKLKKITGTRFGQIVGVNQWATEFEAWCDITGVYKEPFEGNKYTEAGNILEPKVITQLNAQLPFGRIHTPVDVFGPSANHMYDYYPEQELFGGMWDGLWKNDEGKTMGIVEIKTTKRYQDWEKGIPANYQVQAELYAMLSGVDYVTFGVVFLEEADYDNLEGLELVEGKNFKIVTYKLDQYKKSQIHNRMDFVENWYKEHIVDKLESPIASDKPSDNEILDILSTVSVEDDSTLDELIAELEGVQEIIENEKWEKFIRAQKREKELENHIRTKLIEQIENDDSMSKAVVKGLNTQVTVSSKTIETKKFDISKLEKDYADKMEGYFTLFDEKRFKEDYPEIYDEVCETTYKTTYTRSTSKIKKDK